MTRFGTVGQAGGSDLTGSFGSSHEIDGKKSVNQKPKLWHCVATSGWKCAIIIVRRDVEIADMDLSGFGEIPFFLMELLYEAKLLFFFWGLKIAHCKSRKALPDWPQSLYTFALLSR
jgi:hypothetical protein